MFNLLFLSLQEKGAAEKPVSASLSTLSTFLPPVQDIAAVNHNFMHTWLQCLLDLFVFSPVWSEISCVLVMADSQNARITIDAWALVAILLEAGTSANTLSILLFFLFLKCWMKIEPRVLHMQGTCSASETCFLPWACFCPRSVTPLRFFVTSPWGKGELLE